MSDVCIQRQSKGNTEKGLLTTLSSWCNSMKAGMQQRRKTAIRDRDREQGNAEFKTDRRGAERERERDIERKRTDKQTDR